jgi:membrane protease YdiL (CAAX protease family)
VTLLVGLAVTAFLFWKNRQGMSFTEYYLVNTALLLWAPLAVLLLLLRREAADFGMTPGDLRPGLLTALILWALFLPVVVIFSRIGSFQDYYVRLLSSSGALDPAGRLDYGGLLFHETVLGFYMFGWEWYFRGFLLWGLKHLMPVVWAALFQALAFALLHYGKPWPEVASSFFGALLLAAVALRFRSFLPCFVLHWAVSASFDVAVLYHYLRPAGR